MLGVRVDILPVDELVSWIATAAAARRKAVVTYVNVHAMNLAHDDPWFRDFLERADVTFCDGFGVALGARMLGQDIPHRNTPPDWIDQLCDTCVAEGLSLYFLGAAEGVAERARSELERRHPGLNIAGVHHGYFDKRAGSLGCTRVIEHINACRADILVVGFGMPMQERWVSENIERLDVAVAMPVGAMLDYVAGNVPRAPRWLTDRGLEWLARLAIEPRRLWRRYLIGNPRFLLRVIEARIAGRSD